MLEVLRTDYIKFAFAPGPVQRAIHFGHALKNTLVPVMTITGSPAGWPDRIRHHHRDGVPVAGMGLLFIQAVTFADIPVMAAIWCLIALIFVVIKPGGGPAVLRGRSRAAWARQEATDARPRLKAGGRALRAHRAIPSRVDGTLRRDLHAHPG